MATQIGPKIGIEGEKEYRQQIQQIINQTKTLQSAMNKTASTWDKNTSEMTKNAAIAQNLAQKIDLQKQRLAILNTMLEESTAKYGENASATMAWQRAVDEATASINHMEQELKGFKGAEGLSEMSLKLSDFGTRMQNIGQSMTAVGQKMTMSLTLPIAAAGTAAIKLASDTEEARNKVDVVFGSMSESVKEFADNALSSYGLAEGSALQMASTFGAMASAMGLSDAQAASMSTSLTALAADMASFYNVSTEVASTSLQGIFTGEAEALKKFGIVMNQTNLEEFAASQGKAYDKMTEGEKVMTRYAYVMQATKDAQGDFARTSDGTANSLRTFQESLKELGAAFGEQLLPMITPIIQYLTRLVQMFAALPEPIKKFITVLLLIVAAVGPVLMVVGSLMSGLGAIITQGPVIAAAFMSMIPAIQGLAASFIELTAAAAPWLLLAAAIVAVGYLVYSNWDSISAAAEDLASNISSAYGKLMAKNDELKDSVHGFVADVVAKFAEMPKKIVEAIRNAVDRVKEEFDNMVKNAKESGRHFVEGFVQGIKDKIGKVVDACKKVAETVQDFLGFTRPDKGPLHEYEVWMPHFMQGLAKGIKSNVGLVKGAVNDVAKTMALPLDSNATMNMALAGAGADGSSYMGGTTMNVYVDHISELNDLLRIQNQSQQMIRMGAR